CLEHRNLTSCLESNLYNVPRMTHDQLREAIEKRLALAGAQAETDLIDSLLEDVGTELGDLALLELALSQLWEKYGHFGCTLSNEAYSAMGRLPGALSAYVNAIYGEITEEAQKHLVQIFLELVHLGESTPEVGHRGRKGELLSLTAP